MQVSRISGKVAESAQLAGSRKVFGTLFLLLCYLACSNSAEMFHDLFHDHETAVTHSSQAEEDPCHRTLYHNEKQAGCDHDAHFTIAEKCSLCHLLFPTDQAIPSLSSAQGITSPSTNAESPNRFRVVEIQVHVPSRAPPCS